MKQKMILIVFMLFSGMAYAQDVATRDVPSIVLNSFLKTFPKASNIEWEMKGSLYNAEFDVGRRDHEVWLDHKGAIVKHKKEIRTNELPAAVLKSVKQQFKGFRIDDIHKYDEAEQFFYKIELKKFTKEQEAIFDQKGNIVHRIL